MTERPDGSGSRRRQSEKRAALFYLPDRMNKDITHVAEELGITRSDAVTFAVADWLAKHAHLIRRA